MGLQLPQRVRTGRPVGHGRRRAAPARRPAPPQDKDSIKRLAQPRGRHRPHRRHPRPLDGRVARRDDRRRPGLGPDRLRVREVPPPQRRRDPRADALQPADRDPLHRRAGRDGAGVLLLHRHRAERRARRGQARRQGRPHVTVVGQQWSWTFNYVKDDALDGVDRPSTTAARRPTADAGAPGRRERRDQAPLARRDPLVLGAGVPVQDGRRARAATTTSASPRPARALRRPLRRAVRRLPLADAVQRRGRQRRGVRRPPRGASRTRATSGRRSAGPRSTRRPASRTKCRTTTSRREQDE